MISAVVLAAGRSERMGSQKLLLPLGGKPVISRVVDELMHSPVARILVVTGRDGAAIQEALCGRPVQFVPNPNAASDMLGSVRCGLAALIVGTTGVLMAVGDQPGISRTLVTEMIRCFLHDESKIIVPVRAGHRGHPLLFSTGFCPELLSSHDGHGLRGLLDAHPGEIIEVPVACADAIADMDTPSDYKRLTESLAPTVTPSRPPRCDQSG